MNKKNLSVVMAGAMLATSVAPVLADSTTSKEYTSEQFALLSREIKDKMETEMISTYKALNGVGNAGGSTETDFVKAEVAKLMKENQSAYGIKVVDSKGTDIDLETLGATKANTITTKDSKVANNVTFDTTEISNIIKTANASKLEGCTIQLVKRETTNFKGQIIPGTEIKKVDNTELVYSIKTDFVGGTASSSKFATSSSLATELKVTNDAVASSDNKYISEINGFGDAYNASTDAVESPAQATSYYKSVVITTTKPKDMSNPTGSKETITLDANSKRIDGTLPLDSNGNLLDYTSSDDVTKFSKFETKSSWTKSEAITTAPTVQESYKIVESAPENLYKASELYDGVVLTSKGTEIAADLKNAREANSTANEQLVKISAKKGTGTSTVSFEVYYYKNSTIAKSDTTPNGTGAYKKITVYSSNETEIDSLMAMLNGSNSYKVGIVGGANRYETAVNVAKQNNTTVAANGNIVLVNGESLVDGLAAAPLAASLGNKAPVLLTKADSLPESTKEYIKLLTDSLSTAQKKTVTINLVGGESVLSSKLVSELENMGFYVKRLGGKDREATSLKVAEEIAASGNKNAAFVVGGNGEADAMAISAVAAQKETPIIVSSVHGLSDNALTYLNEKSAKGDVTIIGGTSVVSESEEKAINDALVLNKAVRIAGDTRFETNANIIKEYYKQLGTDPTGNSASDNLGAASIVVVKDGMSNKSELVDALSAANYAASNYAPIVLASKELKASQKNALLNVDTVKGNGSGTENSLKKALQIGDGGSRTVLEAVANLFGLSNVK